MIHKRAKKALNSIGDIIIPGDEEMPAFSTTNSIESIEDITGFAPDEDIAQLNLLLIVLSFSPDFVLKWLVKKMDNSPSNRSFTGPLFRQLNFGIKGIIFGLYYGNKINNQNVKNPLETIDYKVNRVKD